MDSVCPSLKGLCPQCVLDPEQVFLSLFLVQNVSSSLIWTQTVSGLSGFFFFFLLLSWFLSWSFFFSFVQFLVFWFLSSIYWFLTSPDPGPTVSPGLSSVYSGLSVHILFRSSFKMYMNKPWVRVCFCEFTSEIHLAAALFGLLGVFFFTFLRRC